ncbi:hypothetical protein [Amycolatopsis minnesotensis]|uniref:Uncharacterized protein n=1 Tax=Amycolatopsis minnesotensis TaxID=337894 RepID=A0ABP5C323_9PSEU
MVDLLTYQHIPVARTAQLLADRMGLLVSTGWVAGVLSPIAAELDDFDDQVTQAIRTAICASWSPRAKPTSNTAGHGSRSLPPHLAPRPRLQLDFRQEQRPHLHRHNRKPLATNKTHNNPNITPDETSNVWANSG